MALLDRANEYETRIGGTTKRVRARQLPFTHTCTAYETFNDDSLLIHCFWFGMRSASSFDWHKSCMAYILMR